MGNETNTQEETASTSEKKSPLVKRAAARSVQGAILLGGFGVVTPLEITKDVLRLGAYGLGGLSLILKKGSDGLHLGADIVKNTQTRVDHKVGALFGQVGEWGGVGLTREERHEQEQAFLVELNASKKLLKELDAVHAMDRGDAPMDFPRINAFYADIAELRKQAAGVAPSEPAAPSVADVAKTQAADVAKTADTQEMTGTKACPHCGKAVTAPEYSAHVEMHATRLALVYSGEGVTANIDAVYKKLKDQGTAGTREALRKVAKPIVALMKKAKDATIDPGVAMPNNPGSVINPNPAT